jgi:DNA-binding PadR family transcriptional regulator
MPALRRRRRHRRPRPPHTPRRMTASRRLPVSDAELGVTAEALREALAAELLAPGSQRTARDLLDRVDAKLPSALDRHPAGASTGRLLAGDEILRLLLAREDRHGLGALSNEQIAGELSWKPTGTSVRELLDELRRAGWLTARGSGPERRFELTRKGRGRCPRARARRQRARQRSARQRTRRAAGPSSTPTAPPARSPSPPTPRSGSRVSGIARPCTPRRA